MKDFNRQGPSPGDHPFLQGKKVEHCRGSSLKLGYLGREGGHQRMRKDPHGSRNPKDKERKNGKVAFLAGLGGGPCHKGERGQKAG